jgi:hypothetical protein
MDIGRIFLIFAVLVGIASGAALVLVPQSRNIGPPPYFWVLIAFALFEGIVFVRRGAAGGPPISAQTRIIGFFVALLLMFLIPVAAGVEVKYF